jgi:hypothetical protein
MVTMTALYANLTNGDATPNQAVVDLVVVSDDTGGGTAADWADITGKPSTFAPTIGTTASTAIAGNDTRLTAGAAATATVRALGTAATTAAAGNDTRLLTGSATAVNSAAGATPTKAEYDALLTALRARGIITGA